ncbi:MAG TPA: hypothetical protein VGM56_04475 [Byssovorax sp.]|jgi:putative lipoprotein
MTPHGRAAATAIAMAIAIGATDARADPADTPPRARAEADPWLGRDKLLHFSFSAVIAGGAYAFATLGPRSVGGRAAWAGGSGVLVGAGKEIIDLGGYGDPSWKDLAWDIVGVAVGASLAATIDASTRGKSPAAKSVSAAISF